MDTTSTKHSAAASTAGYLFQARLALAEALRFAYSDSGIEIAIEKFDDVSFETAGEPIEFLQTKHHISRAGDLTDLSADLWKTLRIWADKVKADPSLPGRVRFTLLTTATAPPGSAAELLRPSLAHIATSRNPEEALRRLQAASANSRSEVLKSTFESFDSLAREMQVSLGTQLASVRRDTPRLQERLGSLEARRSELEDQLRIVQRQIAQRIADNERLLYRITSNCLMIGSGLRSSSAGATVLL